MKKTKLSFNAIDALIEISNELEHSAYNILSIYKPVLSNALKKEKEKKKHADEQLELNEHVSVKDTPLKEKIDQLSQFLNTTPIETLLFVATYAMQFNRSCCVDILDLSRYFGFSGLHFLLLKTDFESLIKKGLINCEFKRGSVMYSVNDDVEQSILRNEIPKKSKAKTVDRYIFCETIASFIENRENDYIDTKELFNSTTREEQNNKNLTFLKNTKKLLSNKSDRTLFYEICNDFVSCRSYGTSIDNTLSSIYDNRRAKFDVSKDILDKTHALIVNDLIELLPNTVYNDAEVILTEKGKRLFLEEDYELFEGKGGHDKRLISPDEIPDRQLIFSKELSENLNLLKESLVEENYKLIQSRLKECNLSTGVNVLLYGLPGTGKTASAEMIAKYTGRSVYHVDIAASKSCWFGESEKLFKRIFDDYRNMCKTEKYKPILLFNEADALFSKRKDLTSSNCAQTENALQNILLEELEKNEGILIATTNLSNNLDSAFDRRFYFKIQYGQPDTKAKQAIWQSKLKWLSDNECQKLAANFDLSGGDIDNIARKSEMEYVLSGTRPDFTKLELWCRSEKLNSEKANTIGFNR